MKIYREYNKKGYSIIAAIMMIGFLIVLCSGILQGVLSEMQDSRGRQEYLKASAAAEGALELGLLAIKQNGYGFNEAQNDIQYLGNTRKSAAMEYEFESKVQSINGELGAFETRMIPLYWIDTSGVQAISGDVISYDAPPELIWNIIGDGRGVSGVGNFTHTTASEIELIDGSRISQNIGDFLSGNPGSYLQIYNNSSLTNDFHLEVEGGDFFTLPTARILARGSIGKYHQNLDAELNNTEFLRILRYSIFSE